MSGLQTELAATAYPGGQATSREILGLADEFRAAAQALGPLVRPGKPVSRAPYRLNALQAVELYLNAFLLHAGREPGEIRGLQHDLAARGALAAQRGLVLRRKTHRHLDALTARREYLLSRYRPEAAATLSELNRLAATLEEVAAKVRGVVGDARPLRTRAPQL